MSEKEKKIKEQRTIEATKKGFMGLIGRFGVIMQNLGQPIILQSSGGSMFEDTLGVTRTELPSPFPEEDEDYCDIPTTEVSDMGVGVGADPEGYGWADKSKVTRKSVSTSSLGWHFDGLNQGIRLEMKYLHDNSELTVHYKGYLVYKETQGDLQTYFPLEEWETHVNSFFKAAKVKEGVSIKGEKEKRLKEVSRRKESWIQKMRRNWGI